MNNPNQQMTAAETRKRMAQVDGILRTASHRFHRGSTLARNGDGYEAVTWDDPFEELARKEEEAIFGAALKSVVQAQRTLELVEVPEALVERIREIVYEEFLSYENTLMGWLFDAGPHPLEVLRRLFAYVKKKNSELLWNMGFRQIGPLLDETHASAALRCKVLFGRVSVGWNKSATACARMRESAMGNRNRVGGRK